LPYVGYTRGESFHRDSIDDVEQKAIELQKKIDRLLRQGGCLPVAPGQ